MTSARSRLLAAVSAQLPSRGRVAVDGVDAAGKTTFADELASVMRVDTARVSIDDYLNPAEVRHRQGRTSPEGYFADSFDYGRMVAELPSDTLVIVDGVFLQRPELAGVWDLVIFLDIAPDESVRRMVVRDGLPDDPQHPLVRRYTDAQRKYRADFAARQRAHLVIDNTDVENPVMLRHERHS